MDHPIAEIEPRGFCVNRDSRAATGAANSSTMVGLNFGLGNISSYLFPRGKPTRGRLLFFFVFCLNLEIKNNFASDITESVLNKF